ncbi:hypothetical protein [Acinetobacter gerneri]|uniref:Lipoprotein n=1 Tax=Acinetobacter gerneri DSM 14967 = CIP 107464 = MTCC 9824 TaxID=1120926 RepID=N8Y9G3_9GAMM|nr:hypothetical protein [Acinetobacter gerneri]ENV33286.1 hypothetical protein F960_02313 [Acinetobacter gerneri DSM 14967 = CIP 107464 = MTCC 9824]EPR81336.1 hypothetical protein L289_3828 [Acinetobacter gerneri DSM 14967 = CIP 107464 = MTCC 9824]
MQKQLYRFFIIFGCIFTTTLSGCKPPANLTETLAEIAIKAANHFSIKMWSSTIEAKWDEYQRSKLPFQLQQGETYEKIETEQQEYYVAHRLSGATEHYALNGKLLWSSAESETASQDEVPPLSDLEPSNVQKPMDGAVTPELSFPDFSAPTYRKFTDPELLQQIDNEYHVGMNLSHDPINYGLNPISLAPPSIKSISVFMNTHGPAFVNQAFGRPNVTDVAILLEGWLDLSDNKVLYRTVVHSARYQCTWYQAIADIQTNKVIYEEFMPCFAPGEENLDAI